MAARPADTYDSEPSGVSHHITTRAEPILHPIILYREQRHRIRDVHLQGPQEEGVDADGFLPDNILSLVQDLVPGEALGSIRVANLLIGSGIRPTPFP
jgi:hypothetical protein